MVTILVEELARLADEGRAERVARVDFGARLPDSVKRRLAEPVV